MAKNHSTVIETVVPGAFYQGVYPGGFSDALTGIHIPGPVVNLDKETKRQVVSIAAMPDPIQLPHLKETFDFKDKDRKTREVVLAPFDRQDEAPLHDAFNLALATGLIRRLEDEEVKERYPKAWAERKEKYVFSKEVAVVPMTDLIEKFNAAQDKEKKRNTKAVSAATGGTPPPPPPPGE